jgi:uncharacterized membrane protein HdeD (DUF308 family)
MDTVYTTSNANVTALAARWWVPVLRGLAAILLGVLAIVLPGPSLLALLLVWGAYAVADGILSLVLSLRGARAGRRWGWLLFEGIVSLAAGLLTFVWPGMTALALLILIAARALVAGVAAIAAAIRLRRQINGEWLLAASGLLSIALGVILIAAPGAGALAIVWTIGCYALVFGALLIAFGLRLQRWDRAEDRGIRPGGAPTPA